MVITTYKLVKSRQKAFSPKVRSGCITCKRRRVKCDEHKPFCFNCTTGNRECLGYNTPKAKIFHFEKPIHFSPEGLSRQTSPSQATKSSRCVVSSTLSKPPKQPFGTADEESHFQHYLTITSQLLAHYGPQGDFFTVTVPQFAWHSPAVKSMLLALSMTHRKFHTGVASVSKTTISQALSCYISAINDIRNNNPSKLHIATASLVAWALELFQNNLPTALTHLGASLRLIQEMKASSHPSQSEEHVVQSSLAPAAGLAKGLSSLMLQTGFKRGEIEPEYSDHLYAPWIGPPFTSLLEARTILVSYLDRLAIAETPSDFKNGVRALSHWFETVRRWDQLAIRSPDLSAVMLLMNIGLSLLPTSDVAGYSYSGNPETITFVVDSATDLALREQRRKEENEDLKETLRIVCGFVIRLFPTGKDQGRARILLGKIT